MDKFERFPIEEVTREPDDGVFDVYVDRYWAVTEKNEVLRYKGASAQCNKVKVVAEKLARGSGPAVKVVFLEQVYLPHCCE